MQPGAENWSVNRIKQEKYFLQNAIQKMWQGD